MPSSPLSSTALNTLSATEAQLEIARLKAELAQVQAENDRLRAQTRPLEPSPMWARPEPNIASMLDLDALLQAALGQLTQQLGSQQGSLWLFEPDGYTAKARAWYSVESQTTSHQALNLLQHPVMQQMLTRHEPLIITQVDSFLQKTVFQDAKTAFSILIIPLRFKEENIGFIVTDNTETDEATLADRLTLAANSAKQTALAIHAATLFESVQKQANRLRLINEVAQQINTVLNVDDLFAILVQAVHHRLGYVAVTMFEVAQNQHLATLRAVTGHYPSWLLPHKYQQALFNGATEQAIAHRKPFLVADIAHSPHLSLIPHTDFQAGIVVPIYINQSSTPYPAALFMVHSNRPAAFNEDDLWTLEALGKQVGIAIENARLYRDATQRLSDMAILNQAINETSRAISNILAMDDLFADVTHLISDLFNQARVGLGLRTTNYITFQHVADGVFTSPPIPPHHRLKIDPAHILGQVLLQGEAQFVAQLPTRTLYRLDDSPAEAQPASAPAKTDSAAFVVPLNIGGKTIGLIVVQSHTWLESQTQDMETLQALASQVAVAMENSRLLQKSREMAIEQERTRLARDMHDGVAQNLAYLLLQVDRCITMAESNNPRLVPELDNMGQILQQNIEELRRHIFNLRPVGLVGRSFFKAIPQLAQEFAAKTQLNTTYHITGQVIDIPAMVENSLYRILQEALSNVRRHAKCQNVTITLHINADHSLSLQVQDDGQGFDPQQMTWNPLEYHGLGLISIKERMRTLGGTFTIQSQPGQGTCLQADVPNLRET